jgi:hypothetical protein
MSRAKLELIIFSDGYLSTDVVAPKSQYPTKEEFLAASLAEYGEDYEDKWADKLKLENVTEAHCRYYPTGFEGWDNDGGGYSFSRAGSGAFPVWRIELQ